MVLKRVVVVALMCCTTLGAAAARPAPAVDYSHALAMLARRNAFWRAHPSGRNADTAEAAERRSVYWRSQERSRAACEAYGTCP